MRELGVADVRGVETAIPGGPVPLRRKDARVLPIAQRRRSDPKAASEFTDAEGRGGSSRRRGAPREPIDGRADRIEGAPIAEQLLVAAIDDHQDAVEVVVVDRVHDLHCRRVPVGPHEREEDTERRRVDLGVDPVATRRASGGREAPVALVVAHRLSGKAVLPSQVRRPQVNHPSKL
jgi:hypothetical protein